MFLHALQGASRSQEGKLATCAWKVLLSSALSVWDRGAIAGTCPSCCCGECSGSSPGWPWLALKLPTGLADLQFGRTQLQMSTLLLLTCMTRKEDVEGLPKGSATWMTTCWLQHAHNSAVRSVCSLCSTSRSPVTSLRFSMAIPCVQDVSLYGLQHSQTGLASLTSLDWHSCGLPGIHSGAGILLTSAGWKPAKSALRHSQLQQRSAQTKDHQHVCCKNGVWPKPPTLPQDIV